MTLIEIKYYKKSSLTFTAKIFSHKINHNFVRGKIITISLSDNYFLKQ